MNDRIKKLFSCCLDNKVVVIETNFATFHKLLNSFEPACKSDRWYFDKFKESKEFQQEIGNNIYYFQKLIDIKPVKK